VSGLALMRLTRHPFWPTLRQWLRIEKGTEEPTRWRIEFRRDTPDWVLHKAKVLVVTCVCCRKETLPVRQRDVRGTWYVCVSCGSKRCTRSSAASALAHEIHGQLDGSAPPGILLPLLEGL
jgi:hypothetical protein